MFGRQIITPQRLSAAGRGLRWQPLSSETRRSFTPSAFRYPRLRPGSRTSTVVRHDHVQPAEKVPTRVEPEEAPKADTSSTPPKQPRPRRIPPQLTQPHDIWRAHSIHLELPPDASTIPVDEASGPPESYFSKTPTKPKAPPAPGTLTFEPTPTPTHALASKLLTTPTPTFLHASSHLRNTRANSALPEIAIIGASNCGKSTFLNAVAHRAHLARTSARAGHTTTMNTYGLGPAPPPATQARARARLGPGERPPRHALAVVDTPGYGFGSRTAWGDGILGYLARRTLLRGVVVLLPADKEGLAQRDAEVLRMVASLGRRVLVVLTKTDKLVRAYRGPEADGDLHGWLRGRAAATVRAVRRACRGEKGTLVPRVYLTAAAMERREGEWKSEPMGCHRGMAGVREAIMEMAGVGELLAPSGKKQAAKHDVHSLEDVPAEKRSETRDPEAWGGETISFEDLEKMYRKK
ncbi:hypothetical protein VD0004_g1234 [Verticillium dahliae]|nr:hypothetical protein VD0004_g1234 [Verticillium dahliae]